MEDINEFTTQRKQFNHVVLKVLKAEAELHNERTTDLSFEFLFVTLSLRYLLSCVATWRGLCVLHVSRNYAPILNAVCRYHQRQFGTSCSKGTVISHYK